MPSSNSTLINAVQEFLTLYPLKKVLIGLSGGPDSMALLFTLLQCRSLDLSIIHVDHGWRKESEEEAKELQRLAHRLNLTFYLKTLDPTLLDGNLEDACRNERLKFFEEIASKEGYEGVFLAHHAGDQVETVLKRVFESGDLHGIRKKTVMGGLALFRPFLKISKKEIFGFLEEHRLKFFTDSTNEDPRFLRAKMRKDLIPLLETSFGKSIQKPVLRLSEEREELEEFMQAHYGVYLLQKDSLDCTAIEEKFPLRWVIKHWLKKEGIIPSFDQMHTILRLVLEKQSGKKIVFQNHELKISKAKLNLIPVEMRES